MWHVPSRFMGKQVEWLMRGRQGGRGIYKVKTIDWLKGWEMKNHTDNCFWILFPGNNIGRFKNLVLKENS